MKRFFTILQFLAVSCCFAQDYSFTFYKIVADMKDGFNAASVKKYFDAAISAGKYEVLGTITCNDGISASIADTSQVRFPEAYDDKGIPKDWVAYDLGFFCELTHSEKDGKRVVSINARYSTRDADDQYPASNGKISKPKFVVSEIRTQMPMPELDTPFILLTRTEGSRDDSGKHLLFIMVVKKISDTDTAK